MPAILKIYIALRNVPLGIREKTQRDLSDPMHYKLGNELELEFVTTETLLNDTPHDIFYGSGRPVFMIVETEWVDPKKVLELGEIESQLKQVADQAQYKLLAGEYSLEHDGISFEFPFQAYEPRIVLFENLVKEAGQRTTVPRIADSFKPYNSLFEQGVAVRAASLKAAVDIVVAKIINSRQSSLQTIEQL